MALEKEKKVFGKRYELIEAIVVMSGPTAMDTPMLDQIITTKQQLKLLSNIVSDQKHPWIREYNSRMSSIENDIRLSWEKKFKRKKALTKVIRASLWKKMTTAQKVKYIAKKTIFLIVFYTFTIALMIVLLGFGLSGLF